MLRRPVILIVALAVAIVVGVSTFMALRPSNTRASAVPSREEALALQGAGTHSTSVLMKYERCAAEEIERNSDNSPCLEQIGYWEAIDAENGSTLGMSAMYNKLSNSTDCRDLHRSIFWLRKLVSSASDKYLWVEQYKVVEDRIKTRGCAR